MKIWILMRLADEDWSFEGAFYKPRKALREAIAIQVRRGYNGDVKASFRSSIYERHFIDDAEFEITQTEIQ